MFENTLAYKRMLKKENLTKELEKAKEDNNIWKIKQLEAKINSFNRKYYPTVVWDSTAKGTLNKVL